MKEEEEGVVTRSPGSVCNQAAEAGSSIRRAPLASPPTAHGCTRTSDILHICAHEHWNGRGVKHTL